MASLALHVYIVSIMLATIISSWSSKVLLPIHRLDSLGMDGNAFRIEEMAFVNQSKRDGQPLSPLCNSRRCRWASASSISQIVPSGWLVPDGVGADRECGDGLAPVERSQLHAAASVAPASPEFCPVAILGWRLQGLSFESTRLGVAGSP